MRQLTFKTYLKFYLRDVSGHDSLNMRTLVSETRNNRRILDSLLLYSVFEEKTDLFNKITAFRYAHVLESLNKDNFLDKDFKDFEFEKIWSSYLSRAHTKEFDNRIKEKARFKILRLLEENEVSKYRLCKDLHLNPGNINDYLKNGSCEKVSVEVLKSINNYLMNLADSTPKTMQR